MILTIIGVGSLLSSKILERGWPNKLFFVDRTRFGDSTDGMVCTLPSCFSEPKKEGKSL